MLVGLCHSGIFVPGNPIRSPYLFVPQISMNLVRRVTYYILLRGIPASDGGPLCLVTCGLPLCVAGYVVSAIWLACGDSLYAVSNYELSCCILRILEIEELEKLRKWADEGHLLSLSGVILCSIPYFFDHYLKKYGMMLRRGMFN